MLHVPALALTIVTKDVNNLNAWKDQMVTDKVQPVHSSGGTSLPLPQGGERLPPQPDHALANRIPGQTEKIMNLTTTVITIIITNTTWQLSDPDQQDTSLKKT